LGSKDADWLKINAGQYGGLVAPFCEAANGDKDTGPLVIKEAMALGLPVISTDFMGVKEIIDEHTGWKVEASNSIELAEAMTQWQLLDTETRKSMIVAARQRVERLFTSAETTKILSNAINQVSYELSH
jgi:glycosyltransferase involved in cell wall biosynthesis